MIDTQGRAVRLVLALLAVLIIASLIFTMVY
jgi:hypothetical protein